MNILSAPSPRHVGDSFIERRAGFVLALCFHVMLFAVLAMRQRPPVVDARPEPMNEVNIQLMPPPVEPLVEPLREVAPLESDTPREGAESPGDQPRPLQFIPSVETAPAVTPMPVNAMGETVNPAQPEAPAPQAAAVEAARSEPLEQELMKDEGDVAAVPAPDLEAETTREAVEGSSELQSRLDAARRQVDVALAETLPAPDSGTEARIDAASEQGSDEIAERLRMLDMDVRAQQSLFRSKGAQEGVIRSLVLTGVDKTVSQQVMERYGIRIIPVLGDSSEPSGRSGAGYLSRASTDEGQFVQGTGRGNFLRFIISRQAGMRMMQLEAEEMERRGFDPAKSRLIEVEFGVVPTTDGYDLGVRKMIAEALPGVEDYEKSPDAPSPGGASGE